MEGRQLFKIAAGYFCIDVGYAEDAVIIAQTVAQRNKNLCQYRGVVSRAVVVEAAQPQIIRDRVELDIFDVGQDRARDGDRVDRGVGIRHVHILARLADKGGIERGVVRH